MKAILVLFYIFLFLVRSSVLRIKTCWSSEIKNVNIPDDAQGTIPYKTLEEAKVFCELLRSKCYGITWSSRLHYRLRVTPALLPDASTSSWVKQDCNGDEPKELTSALLRTHIPGIRTSSVPKGFWVSPFVCNTSAAKDAKQKQGNLTEMWIWGERNSGTGLATILMERNVQIHTTHAWPWKHNLMHLNDLSHMDSILNLIMIKDAFAWFWSMYKHPNLAQDMKNLTFEAFLFHPWHATAWRTPYDFAATYAKQKKTRPAIRRRNLRFRERYQNIFQLRAAKLLSYQAVLPCLPFSHVVRYDDFNQDVEKVIKDVGDKFKNNGLEMEEPINTTSCVIVAYRCQDDEDPEAKRRYYLEKKYLENYTPELIKLVLMNLDFELEASFGLHYDYISDYFPQFPTTVPTATRDHFKPMPIIR